MILDNIERLKSSISIHANKKTSNILDGSYRSIYKGNGLNFEDLREYIPGDNVRDIDWKASSRSKGYLVKRYISEKKKKNRHSGYYFGLYGNNRFGLRMCLGIKIGHRCSCWYFCFRKRRVCSRTFTK